MPGRADPPAQRQFRPGQHRAQQAEQADPAEQVDLTENVHIAQRRGDAGSAHRCWNENVDSDGTSTADDHPVEHQRAHEREYRGHAQRERGRRRSGPGLRGRAAGSARTAAPTPGSQSSVMRILLDRPMVSVDPRLARLGGRTLRGRPGRSA